MTGTIRFANNAITTLAAPITDTAATTLTVASGTGALFPPVTSTSGNFFTLTLNDVATRTHYEIMHVTDVTGDTFTISRGQESTVAQTWAAGDIAANMITAATLNATAGAFGIQAGFDGTVPDYLGNNKHLTANTTIAVGQTVTAEVTGSMFLWGNINITNQNTSDTTLILPASANFGGILSVGQSGTLAAYWSATGTLPQAHVGLWGVTAGETLEAGLSAIGYTNNPQVYVDLQLAYMIVPT